jgi:hypothetical protein
LKKIIFKRALIIGPRGIGRAHIRQYIINKIKKIAVLGKKFNKNRIIDLKIPAKKKLNLINVKNYKEIEKFNPQIVSICSPHYTHLSNLKKISFLNSRYIIEKPFFWVKNVNENYIINHTKYLFNKYKNRLIVNLPMTSIANQLKKKFIIKEEIKKIDFNYFTDGAHQYNEIAIDLLPHAISFVLSMQNNFLYNFKIKSVKSFKFSWRCKIIINNVLCNFFFKQGQKLEQSHLSFNLNNKKYLRIQEKINNNEFKNYLLINNKKIFINNPMSESLNNSIKSLQNLVVNKSNYYLVQAIMKLTFKLLNYNK